MTASSRARYGARLVHYTFCLALLGSVAAKAQGTGGEPNAPASADDKILSALERAKQEREGLVIVGVDMTGSGLSCWRIDFELTRLFGGKVQRVLVHGLVRSRFGIANVAPRGIGAGEWVLGAIKCAQMSGGGTTFNGSYARITLSPAEVVDAGTLRVDYTRGEFLQNFMTGDSRIRMSVEPTPEDRLAELKRQIPRVMALAKKRPMALIGPVERKMQRAAPPRPRPADSIEPEARFQQR